MSPNSRPTRFPTLAKYDVVEELGHGGMATVYRAHDKRLGRDVAIKVIHPHLRDSKEVAHRFFVEAKAVAKLRHPNIVEVFDVSSEDEAEQYLVVELLRGKTLRKLLVDNGAMPPEVAAALGIELLDAIVHAHAAGVIHRDVKPENVLIEPPNATESDSGDGHVRVKLTDFGIAKLLDVQGVTSTGQVLGSPAHMAPEQIEGASVDERADVFGLGVLLYECMVGHLPFEGQNPAQVLRRVLDGLYAKAERERATVGAGWSSILDRALARDPAQRYATAVEMRDALTRELTRYGVTEPRGELEAWIVLPNAYAEDHAKKIIARACELGAAARKRHDVIEAAAHYNRALAYAPSDPALLKVVTTMNRAEERSRIAKRVLQLALGIALMSGLGYGVARVRRPSIRPEEPPVATIASAPVIASSVVAPAIVPSGDVPATKRNVLTTSPILRTAPRLVHRSVTLASVRPFGVVVSLDGAPPIEARDGTSIALSDDKAHQLRFTCVSDLCEPLPLAIAAGDTDVAPPPIELKIRDASLVVEGNSVLHYAITEHPSLNVRAGIPVAVPMRQRSENVHIIERETDRTSAATLTAGKEAHASFPL